MWRYKEILFEKFAHLFHSVKMIFENSTKVRTTHFTISPPQTRQRWKAGNSLICTNLLKILVELLKTTSEEVHF